MPLKLDLLHEEHAQLKQRQRDPLKLGIYALSAVTLLFVVYYGYRVVSVSAVKDVLASREAEWRKQAPMANAAEKTEKDINLKMAAATAVGHRVENRFYWAPVLEQLSKAVTPNIQLASLNGTNELVADRVKIVLEGIAAGAEPRGAAEQFRLSLTERLGTNYPGTTATFRSLEEASPVPLGGKQLPSARFTIDLDMKKPTGGSPTAQQQLATTETRSSHS